MPRKRNNLLTAGSPSVKEAQAKQLISLVDNGMTVEDAEAVVGVKLTTLRNSGVMHRAVMRLIEATEEANVADEVEQKKVARARLVELALQDEDLKVSVAAAKSLADTGGPKVQNNTQVNYNITNPEVMKALASLGLLVKEEGGK